ncbi:histone-lysine N-methyltransferase trr isoform X2 [Drosophila rhopaloa]|uniref:Histone-lysine N-methyltransferase trr isoform X2 n=1 Tax=Drosophila rhopaloa TaxID=1041015 RepID=A0A6P4F4X8_DRORH|nr:histone-lysine N-methyltransferase trr isoform X2 [Drosophila rhopaloa]
MNIPKVTTSLGAAEKAKPERVASVAAAAFNAVNLQKRSGADDPATAAEDPTRKKAKTELQLGTPSLPSLPSLPAKASAAPPQQLLYQRVGQQVKAQVKGASDPQDAQSEDVAWDARDQQIIVRNFGSGAEIKAEDADKQTFASFTKKEGASSSASSSSSTASIISIEPSGSVHEQANNPGKADDLLDFVLMPAAVADSTVSVGNATGTPVQTTSTIILNTNNGATGASGAGTTTILTQKPGHANYNIFNTTATGSQTPTTLLNRVNLPTKMKTQLVVNAKKLTEVTQTTAKVSIGNKTISVPLLKPLMSGAATAGGATIVESKQLLQQGGQVTTVMSAAQPGGGQQVHQHVHTHANPHAHHSFTKLIKRVPKNSGTIVSFSGLQIKPATTKIVATKVVGKKMSLQLQQQLQQQQLQQQLQVTSGAGLAPPTGIVTITTANPSQTYAMVQDATAVGAASHSKDEDAPAPRKITYTENLQKILNKSKAQESGGSDEFPNINSVVIKPLEKNTLNCPSAFNFFKQQHSQAAQNQTHSTVGSGAGTPVTLTMTPASGSGSDLATTSTVSVSAATICINSPMTMGSRPIISIGNKNISLVLSKTTMAQQKPKMITTTTLASHSALQMHHALVQDSNADKAGSGSGSVPSATSGSASVGAAAAVAGSMQLKLTTVTTTPAKLNVSLAPEVAKIEEIAAEPKAKLLLKQEAAVKDAAGTPSSEQERSEETSTTEKRLNANTTMTPIGQVQNQTANQVQVATPTSTASNPSTPNPPASATVTATPTNNQRSGTEDSNNALLKKLLQNSSSNHGHSLNTISIPSAHVGSANTTAPLSARKVINVRAPSMGMVSSLEAQLARPVIPPVPTATQAAGSSSSGGSVATSTTTTTVASGSSSQQVVATASATGTPVTAVAVSTPGVGGEPKLEQKTDQPLVVATITSQNQNQNQNQTPQPPPAPALQQQQQQSQQQPQQSQQLQLTPHQVKQTVQIVSKETSFISGPVATNKLVTEATAKPAELLPPPPYELATAPISNVTISISTKQAAPKELQMKPKAVAMSLPMEQGEESLPEQAEPPPHPEQGVTVAGGLSHTGGAIVAAQWSNSNHVEAGVGATKIPFKPGEAQKRKLPMHPQLDEKQLQQQVEMPISAPLPATPTGQTGSDKVQLISAIASYVKKSGAPGEAQPIQNQNQNQIQSQGQVQMQAQMQAAMQGQLAGQIPGQVAGHIPGQIPAQMHLQVQQHQLHVAVHPQQHQQQQQQQQQHYHHQQQQPQQQQQQPPTIPVPIAGQGPVPIPVPTMETKAGDQRKRRKREVQKPRRTNLNAGHAAGALKDLTGTLPAGAMVQLAGMPPGTQYIQGAAPGTGHVITSTGQGGVSLGGMGAGSSPMLKKRVRKFSKVEEDYDAFTEKLLTHIRQMQPLQVLEPHLNRNFHFLIGSNEASGGGSPSSSSCTASASGSSSAGGGKLKGGSLGTRGWPLSRHLEGLEDCDGAILGRFGRVRLPGIPSLYDSERFGGSGGLVGGSAATRSPSPSSVSPGDGAEKALPMSSIQNDFYDQEFSTHMERNPRERLLRHIGAVKDCNLETIDLVESEAVAAWAALPRLTRYPGLILLNGNSRCHGRMSPVALPEDPLTMRVPVSPLLRSCGEELRKAQQLELGMGSLGNNNNNNNYQQKNQNVILALPASASENIAGVLRDLANLLHLAPALTCKIIEDKMGDKLEDHSVSMDQDEEKHRDSFKRPLTVSHSHLMKILNGRRKLCRSCGNVVQATGLRVPRHSVPALEEQQPRLAQLMAMLPRKSAPPPFVFFCDRACFAKFKWSGKEGQSEAASLLLQPACGSTSTASSTGDSPSSSGTSSTALAETVVKQEPEDEADHKQATGTPTNLPVQRKCIVKCFSADCFATDSPAIKLEFDGAAGSGSGTGTGAANNTVWESEASGLQLEDTRQCVFCNQRGDGQADGPSRLLNFDVDKWVHLNCALWSNGVYETVSGALMNFQTALQAGLNQVCSACHQLGATIKCFKSRCNSLYHLPCAIREECVFYKNKSVHCSAHGHAHAHAGIAMGAGAGSTAGAGVAGSVAENELGSLVVHRRVFVDRDENRQVATVMHYSELSNLLRVGNMTFLNVGQLLPHQLEAFHTPHYIYPIGYKVSRYYWCVRRPNRRCRYICSIAEAGCKPEFRILVQDAGDKEPEREFRDSTPSAVWQQILQPITRLRKVHKWLQLFPQHISGEDLFGLTEPAIVRILESLPGIETLTDYRFKYGRNPLLEFPLAINPSGAARTEPKQRQLLVWRKPHTQRTAGSCSTQRMANSAAIAGEVACPYSKQFVHSKSSQYKKMKQEWRNNVYLARSKIQGLGLYAARDIEKHTMIIEYIGEVIRTEVSEIREKQYESKNRGIYMFRLDEDRVVDATLSGGLARYINHSCNPNCVTEIVEVDRDVRIIIFAKRKIYRGEELSYDYKFDIEDESHKIPCACGAPNCRKWMN